MWVGDMPVAETPLWQLAQLLVTPTWLNSAPPQLSVVWQASHSRSVTMCVGPLPCACTPLWQVEQLPRTCVRGKFTAGFRGSGGFRCVHTGGRRGWWAGRAAGPLGQPACGMARDILLSPAYMTL